MLSYIDMDVANNSHAVPQNIMSVEFKLIGDLSIKQFVFIAVPLVLGFLMYVFHVNNYITIFLTGILLLAAVFIDFVPIDQRPLDIWITNFLIAIKHPTQRVWRKKPQYPSILEIPKQLRPVAIQKKNEDVATFLYQSPIDTSLVSEGTDILDEREKALISNIDRLNNSMGTSAPSSVGVQNQPSSPDPLQQTPIQQNFSGPSDNNNAKDNEKENKDFYYESENDSSSNPNPPAATNPQNQANQDMGGIPSYSQYSQYTSSNQPMSDMQYTNSNTNIPNNQDSTNTSQVSDIPQNPSSGSVDENFSNNYSNPMNQAYGNTEDVQNNFSVKQDTPPSTPTSQPTTTDSNLEDAVSGIINNNNINNTSYQGQSDLSQPKHEEADENIIPPEYRFVDEGNTSQIQTSPSTNTIGVDEIMDRLKKLEEENEELRSKLEEKPKEETIETPTEKVEDQPANAPAEVVSSEEGSQNTQQNFQNPTLSPNASVQKPLSKDDLIKYLPDFVNNPCTAA